MGRHHPAGLIGAQVRAGLAVDQASALAVTLTGEMEPAIPSRTPGQLGARRQVWGEVGAEDELGGAPWEPGRGPVAP